MERKALPAPNESIREDAYAGPFVFGEGKGLSIERGERSPYI